MTDTARTTLGRYGVAVAAIVLATAARFALDPALGDHLPYVTYFVAIMAVARYGGLGPSLATLALGSLTATYFFVPPRGGLVPHRLPDAVGIGLYFFVGTAGVLLCEALRDARRRAEVHAAQVAQEEGRLRITLASIGDAVIATDAEGRVGFMNPVAEALTGWRTDEAAGQPLPAVFRIVNEETRREVENPALRAFREGVAVGLANHTVLIARDGTERPIEDSAAPIRDAGGGVSGVVLVFRDVTGRRRAEEALREREGQLRLVTDHAPVLIAHCDSQRRFKFVNRAYAARFGLRPEDIIGRTVPEVLGRAAYAVIEPHVEAVLAGRRVEFEADVPYQGLGTLRMRAAYEPESDGESRVVGWVAAITDVTERRLAEGRVRFQAHLLDAVGQATIATDPHGRVVYWNRSAEMMYGWSADEATGRSITELVIPPEEAGRAAEVMGLMRAGESWSGEFTVRRRDGTTFPAFVTDTPVFDDRGALEAVIGVSSDLTERKRAEKALALQARVLESMTEGVSVSDEAGTIIYTNPAEDHIFGYGPGELVGKHVTVQNDYPPEENARIVAGVIERLKAVGSWSGEWRNRKKDGTPFWTYARITPIERGGERCWVCVQEDITERKRAEEEHARLVAAAEQQRRIYETVLSSTPDFNYIFDLDGRFTFVNAALLDLWRKGLDEAVGRDFFDLGYPPELAARHRREIEQVIATKEPVRAETPYTSHLGERQYEYIFVPVLGAGGEVVAVAGTTRDITDRKAAEEALRQSEERFARFMEHLPGVAWIKDLQGRYVYVNDAAERAFGTRRSDFYGRTDEEVFPPETAAQFRESDRRVLEAGAGVQVVESQEHIDGTIHHTLVSKFPMPGPDGGSGLVGGMALDITDRMRAEEAIRASEGRFRHLADAMPQIVWVTRPDRSVEYVNRRWLDYTGQTPEEALGPGGWAAAVHPEDIPRIMEASARSHATGEPFEAEYRIRDASGAYRWHLGRAVPILDEAGRLVRRFGAATDIDDRKRSEGDARFLAEASAGLASIVDEASTLQRVARLAVPAFADWCSVDLADEGGLPRRLAVAHIDPAKVELAHELHRRYPPAPDAPHGVPQVIRTGRPEMVAEITDDLLVAGARDDDHLRILRELGLKSYMCVPLRGRAGTLGAMSFVSAESGRRYGEDDLRLAEDLASRASIAIENARLYAELREADLRKDEFLATLAHELRNPLAPIRNALHLMGRPDGSGHGHEEERAMAERQVVHLARLIDDLMDVARISKGKLELQKEVVDLHRVVRQAVETARTHIDDRRHILSVTLPEGPIWLEADPTRLEQVFWNLLNNAAKYTEPGGRIALSADRDGGQVVFRVRDTGIGIAPEMVPRLFQMFVQVGEHRGHAQGGLGIGLGLVRTLVEMHGGSITAHSDGPGTGSEFVVRLPALTRPPHPAAGPGRDEGRRPRAGLPRRRILVVDDNADAANSLARLLTRLYRQDVRVAHDGPEALKVADDFQPEVVLLDIGMPGMDGYEVARRLRGMPEAEGALLVALTGWGQDSDRERSAQAGFDRHLVKPVDPETLRELLAGLQPDSDASQVQDAR